MEFLLLWADELDDTWGVVRHFAPRIAGFLVALALFAATGLGLIHAPHLTLALFAFASSVGLLEAVRRRRARPAQHRDG